MPNRRRKETSSAGDETNRSERPFNLIAASREQGPGGIAHEAGELHRLLVESVQDYAIFALDPDGYILSWNAGAERFKGYTYLRCKPRTGRTHQLRLHMNSLGIPILGDDFYPVITDKPVDDFTRPLQLLAATLEFTDPVTGEHRRFDSGRHLQAWADPQGWAAEAEAAPGA